MVLLIVKGVSFLKSMPPEDPVTQKEPEKTSIVAHIEPYYIDDQGVITRQRPAFFVPSIDVVTPPLIEGEQIIDPAIVSVLSLIQSFSRSQLAIEQVKIYNDNYIELALTDQTRVVCSVSCEPFSVVSTLQSIYTAYKIEGRKLDLVDFRFSKPFIVERYGT